MIFLPPPTVSAKDAFELCISRIRNADLAERAGKAVADIVAADSAFRARVQAGQAQLVKTPTTVGPGKLTKDEMVAMYDDRMVDPDAPGRPVYQAIFDSAEWCPMCGHRDVVEVDHYLPKAHYIDLVTSPLNLVPACSVCNKRKKDRLATAQDEIFLHPYFEDIHADPWLAGSIPNEKRRAVVFSVQPCPSWSPSLLNRVRHQFKELGLAELFAAQAADELSGIADDMAFELNRGGPDAVKRVLARRAASYRSHRPNTWKAVAYASWARSDWFQAGGFL